MASETATVETLTAEVRVLMVGNRQITLSVAKQLDAVCLDNIDVFGRINLGKGVEQVIGRERGTGNLVRCEYWDWDPSKRPLSVLITLRGASPDELPVMGWGLTAQGNFYHLNFRGRSIHIHRNHVTVAPFPGPEVIRRVGDGDFWNAGALGDSIQDQITADDDRWRAREALFDEANSSPLIVLAGLR